MIQRITQGAGFFGPIQNGDGFGALRDGGKQMFALKWPEQAHFDQAYFFTLALQIIDDLLDGFA